MNAPAYPVDLMIDIVASFHRVERDALLARYGGEAIQWPRHELAYVMQIVARMSLRQIGEALDGRDDKTVSNSIERVEKRRAEDAHYDDLVSGLIHSIVYPPRAVTLAPPTDLLGCIRILLQSPNLSDEVARRAALALIPLSSPEGDSQTKES